MAKESYIQITDDSDSSTGSNGDTHIPAITVPFAGAQLESEGSSTPVAPMKHKPSKEPAQTSKKMKGVEPPPPKPNETETAAPIQQRTPSLRINSSNNPVYDAVLSRERRLDDWVAGPTYTRPYGGGSKPHPLVSDTFSRLPNGRGSGAPDPDPRVRSPQPHHPDGAGAYTRPYGGGSKPHPLVSDTFSRLPNGRGSGAPDPDPRVRSPQPHHPDGAGAYPAWRYHPYLRQNQNQQPLRGYTVDYLSQMEASTSAPVQVQRENPSNEVLAQWGETLTLGNGKGKRVDLKLRIRLG